MGTEFEASNPYDSDAFARLRERVLADINRAHTAAFDEYYERTGEMPTSSAQLWSTERPSEHNPYPADGRPAALDITPGWYAPPERWDLIADAEAASRAYAKAHPLDGMWDLPPLKVPVSGPGEWMVPARDDFATVYAAVDPGNDDTGEWGSYKACQADGFGGYWMVDAPPIDHAFARPIVEAAMRGMGMNVPFRSIIKRLRRGGTGG